MYIGLSGKVLPIHPQPKDDEIFSSWFCRIAQENGIKLHTLEVKLWGRDKQIWTRDIDKSIDAETLEKVASVCGTSVERASQTCLRSYEGILFERLITDGNSHWIKPAGIFHRKRSRCSMQFCPSCLATDETPYFRKKWRLALSTFCDVHDVLLHDCCPDCQSPVVFHRQELGQRWTNKIESLTLCVNCGFDLRRAPVFQAPVLEIHSWLTLKSQMFFLDQGWTFTTNQTFPFSHLYFDVLRNLVHKLRSNWTPGRLLDYFDRQFYMPINLKKHRKEQFEFYDLLERHFLLLAATWFLADWPGRLLEIGEHLKIRYSELMRDFSLAPYWYVSDAQRLEFKPMGPSDGEKDAMRQLLMKTVNPEDRKKLEKIILKRNGNVSMKKYFEVSD